MGETKAGLVCSNVLLIHLVGNGRRSAGRKARAEREAAKHVESFGVDLWIRVQFPAPPPATIADCQFPIAD